MTKLLNRICDSLLFWRIMFFVMAGCFVAAYANPRIVVQDREVFLIYEHESYDYPIVRTRAI